jgi:hypothetical protein
MLKPYDIARMQNCAAPLRDNEVAGVPKHAELEPDRGVAAGD